MKLTILGSGTYQPELERHGSAYLIETKNSKICFDFGRGAIEQLLKIGVHVNQLDSIFISHWHGDHISDLIPLLQITISPPYNYGYGHRPERTKPLKIFGPVGTLDRIKSLVKVMHENEELNHLVIKELKNGNDIDLLGCRIKAYVSKHNENLVPMCYRLDAEGKIFAYSGDSVESDGLRKAVRNADLAVIEASWPEEVKPRTHLTGDRAGKIAKESGVKKLVITHMSPLYMKNYNPQKDAEETFGREVIVAKDLLEIEI